MLVDAEKVEALIERIARLSKEKQDFMLGFIAHLERERDQRSSAESIESIAEKP